MSGEEWTEEDEAAAQAVVDVKLILLDELIKALREEGTSKMLLWSLENTKTDLVFYKLEFALSGEAQARVDAAAVQRGVWAMGPS